MDLPVVGDRDVFMFAVVGTYNIRVLFACVG